jgi:hypothetical protein
LREGLIEQQIASRAVEFQGKTFSRPISGGAPAPTLDRLIEFHESATQAGDDPAREWARRQLEGIRPQLLDTNDSMRVDRATQRPDQVNARLVARYLEALAGMTAAECEGFVRESLAARDANACCAVFLHAREAPEGTALRWVRAVLDGVSDFPDNAVDSLRFWEVESRSAETKAAVGEAEYAAAVAVAEARMPGLEPPDPSALLRRERLIARPVALPGEAIGLNLEKRGRLPEELLSSAGEEPAVVGAAMESAQ